MSESYKFEGWVAKNKDSVKGQLVWEEYTPKPFEETDVDIQMGEESDGDADGMAEIEAVRDLSADTLSFGLITHCGICASDLHTLRSGWGETDYPQVVGHEIVGKVVKVGSKVTHLKLGDRVGVGAQAGSCLNCEYCTRGDEPYCNKGMIGTYGGRFPDNSKSYGGYADYTRVPAHFVFKIPDGIPSDIVAPMMCGGVTVYSPLKQGGAAPGKRVGVVGIGGLGHFALLFGKAMGADMVAISHSKSKKADAEKMGVKQFISTHDDENWSEANARSLDLIVCTANNSDMPIQKYLRLLKPGSSFILVGAPEEPLPQIPAFAFISHNVFLGGSLIGGTKIIEEMLQVAVKSDVKTWIQVRNMKDANAAVVDMDAGKARYRYVLVNEKHANL
ncbi:hypothetical protein HK097_007939 [Rhizophlyctis rosea]|uniref:alcohol dehydrogenase (NADP(+)) n=1 Tax=Rhizophlyctis rosea TaxID=64517 RepID=A0AAD5X489_9FUNG|nr:hypothetical protein HK097_007939 [Rhizophlyctis rosea]